jgi:hypothetical protein
MVGLGYYAMQTGMMCTGIAQEERRVHIPDTTWIAFVSKDAQVELLLQITWKSSYQVKLVVIVIVMTQSQA